MTQREYWIRLGVGMGLLFLGACAPLVDGDAEQQSSSTVVGNPSKGFVLNLARLRARYSGGEAQIYAKNGFVILDREFTENDLTIALAKDETTKAVFTKRDFDRSNNELINTAIPAEPDATFYLTVYVANASHGRERVQVIFRNGAPSIARTNMADELADNEASRIAEKICDRIIDCFGATTHEACMEGILATYRLADNLGVGTDSTLYKDVVAGLEASKVSVVPESYSQCLADIAKLDCGVSGTESTIASGYHTDNYAHNWFSDTEAFIPKSCAGTFSGEAVTDSMNVATELMQEMCIRVEKCLGSPIQYCEDELAMLPGLAHEFGIPVNTSQGIEPDLPMSYLVDGIANGFVLSDRTAYENCFYEIGGIECNVIQDAYEENDTTYRNLIALIPNSSQSCGAAFINNIENGMMPGSTYCILVDPEEKMSHCVGLDHQGQVQEYYENYEVNSQCKDPKLCNGSKTRQEN